MPRGMDGCLHVSIVGSLHFCVLSIYILDYRLPGIIDT